MPIFSAGCSRQGTIPNEQMFAQMIDVLVTGDGLSGPSGSRWSNRARHGFSMARPIEIDGLPNWKKTWWFSMADIFAGIFHGYLWDI